MTKTKQTKAQRIANSRDELARRIRAARKVSVSNDPSRSYRRAALECMRGKRSYNRTFGIGKARKP